LLHREQDLVNLLASVDSHSGILFW
jgi:hypothetical protein